MKNRTIEGEHTDLACLISVTNDLGVTFNTRLVRDGDPYGRRGCLTHSGEPVIEFYDARHTSEQSPFWTNLGQFVSRYYLSTFCDGGHAGLCLHGGVDGWTISADNRAEIMGCLV